MTVPPDNSSRSGRGRTLSLWQALPYLVAILVCLGCSQSDVLSPAAFTREFADAFRKAQPGLKVVVVKNLELKLTTANGHESTSFLDNAYDAYKQNPKAKNDVLARFVSGGLDALNSSGRGVDRTRIVPVLKDRAWLEETRQTMLSRGAKEAPEHVSEDFSAELIVLYAEDSPTSIRYLGPKDLEQVKVKKTELRALACENLQRLLPKIERRGTNGVYMLTAGGDYEASLLLLDAMWNAGELDVKGDVVVAIPARGLLLVTGSQHPQGIKTIQQMAKEAATRAPYRLTEKLFVHRNGRFDEFKESKMEVTPP
jgi:uncharacterized protein YtpQ (UPF0354 family)